MARQASNQPADSSANLGIEATAMRDSAILNRKAIPQVVSVARDNNAKFAWVQHFIRQLASQGMAGFVPANPSL